MKTDIKTFATDADKAFNTLEGETKNAFTALEGQTKHGFSFLRDSNNQIQTDMDTLEQQVLETKAENAQLKA